MYSRRALLVQPCQPHAVGGGELVLVVPLEVLRLVGAAEFDDQAAVAIVVVAFVFKYAYLVVGHLPV